MPIRTIPLSWTLSLAAHTLAVLGLARGGAPAIRPPVTIEIVQRPRPQVAAAAPAPSAPAAAAPAAPPPTSPRPRAVARAQRRPAATTPTPPAPAPPAPATPGPAPATLSAAPPTAGVASTAGAPAASARAAAGAPRGGGGGDLRGYLGVVHRAVAARRRYPALALQLSLEGTVEIRVCVRPDGSLACRPAVVRSSGHEDLDQEALRTVARAAPLPPLPPGFDGASAELRIPIDFSLD